MFHIPKQSSLVYISNLVYHTNPTGYAVIFWDRHTSSSCYSMAISAMILDFVVRAIRTLRHK